MKMLKIGGIFLMLALMLAALWLYRPLPSVPNAASLTQGSDQYSVEIVRDKWGVPHIQGVTDADASFGLAYAHAEDDFQTTQELVAATRGVLAEYRGFDAAPTDYVVRLMRIWNTVDQRYQANVPEDVKAIAAAYAAGLNLYAAHHPDETWRGLAPFTEEDVVAGFMFKTPFFYGFDKTLLALFESDREVEIAMAPTSASSAWSVNEARQAELGSNAMAIRAKRSGDDTTRLLINSHQPMTGPVAWYEAHLVSAQGLNITGGVFPGTPVILHGFNLELGWANTVNHIDLVDTYVLEINPDNPMQYRLDGKWLDFEVEEVTINVQLLGPFRFPAKRTLLRSEHGPVVASGDNMIAIRYAGMGEIRQLEQYYRLNQARNLDTFLQAMSLNALPSINYVYADAQDNIAFIHNAQYPNRDDAWDWSKDLPGNRSDLIWQGYRDFRAVPKLVNPKSGLLFNANNTPFSATDGDDNLRAGHFPRSMGLATDQTNRSLRLIEMNDGKNLIGGEQLLQQKFDTVYSKKSKYVALINDILALDFTDNAKLLTAQRHLKAWDQSADIKNRHAALAITILRALIRSDKPDDRSPVTLSSAVADAVDYLERHFGRIDPEWGEVNRLVRGEISLPVSGGPDLLRAIYSYGHTEDETPFATHGDTWIALVEWLPSGQQRARVVHQFGSATLDESSPHYADQAPLFANQQWREVETDMDEIRRAAERIYRPQDVTSR